MKIAYVRVSTKEQNLDSQVDALEKYGVDKIYTEKESGFKSDRKVLKEVIDYLRPGDTLVVYDLSRLGRTPLQVMQLIEKFDKENIGFVSLTEGFDTKTPIGKAFAGFVAIFNSLQISIQKEKGKIGLKAARERGRIGGRKPIPAAQKKQIYALYDSENYSLDQIAQTVGISRRTVANYVKVRKGEENE